MVFSRQRLSRVKTDGRVILFPTTVSPSQKLIARGPNEDTNTRWIAHVHGWIFEPEEKSLKRRAFISLLRTVFDIEKTDEASDILRRRARSFLVDNDRGKRLSVRIGGENGLVVNLPRSRANGHFRKTVKLNNHDIMAALKLPGDMYNESLYNIKRTAPITLITPEDDDREFSGIIHFLPLTGLSVISDIDDTVKISNVLDKKSLLRTTFLEDFVPVPGMSDLFKTWEKNIDASFHLHFVSAAPWQLYEELSNFLNAQGFPQATFHLRSMRLKDKTILNLFRSPLKEKMSTIESILETYPERQFVLVGDSGEKDPECYGEILRRHPNQVKKAFIRNVTNETKSCIRFTIAFAGLGNELWELFDDASKVGPPI